jgi:hypothetical protein
MLDELEKGRRKELIKAATRLHKSGAEPNEAPVPERYTRAQLRQAKRALGWRGSKTNRHNVVKRLPQVMETVMLDEALSVAKDRVEHPLSSRLRRR